MHLRTPQGGGHNLRVGQVVEVRPAAELLATLDDDGATDALPFMPEMLRFAGRRFTVSAHAQKLCDTRSDGTGNRLFRDTVYLDDLRCDGSAHGGCQAGCRLLWRTAWLRPVSELVVQLDELLVSDEPGAEVDADTIMAHVRTLLRPDENGGEFQRNYHRALQDSPEVVLAHAQWKRLAGVK